MSKFCVSGTFVAHVVTQTVHDINYPTDVLWCEDGSLMVVSMSGTVRVGVDGVTTEKIDISWGDDDDFWAHKLAYFPPLDGVSVRERDFGMLTNKSLCSPCVGCARGQGVSAFRTFSRSISIHSSS